MNIGNIFKTNQEMVIFLIALTLFLPIYLSTPIYFVLLIYTLAKGTMVEAYRSVPWSLVTVVFSIFSFIISWINNNVYGVGCSVLAFLVLAMGIYVQRFGNQRIFDFLLRFFVFMSIFCAIYGLFEYKHILANHGIQGFPILAFDKPQDRINSTFFNANYYAMMIEFICTICVYLFLQEKRVSCQIYYVLVGVLNLFMLYLTACRTAWFGLLVAIVFVVFAQSKKIYRYLMSFFLVGAGGMLYLKPTVIPRIEVFGKYFLKRKKIWIASVEEIAQHPFIGKGPLTYNLIYSKHPGATKQIHAHSIYLDPLLSYGLVGCLLFLPYLVMHIQYWLKTKQNRVIMLAFTLIVLIHGLLDLTIFFVSTAMIYLIVLGSHFKIKEH